jgi:hypothetical protein
MLDAIRISNVADNATHMRSPSSQAIDRGSQRGALDIGEHYIHARLSEGTAECKPNSACAACDECRPASEFPHFRLLRMHRGLFAGRLYQCSLGVTFAFDTNISG